MDCEEIARRVHALLVSAEDQIVCAYLFGSVARGEATDGSDVDLAILLRETPEGKLTDLRFTLEGRIERNVGLAAQVVVLNDAPADLVHQVLLDGRLLIDRDPSARVRFEVRARNEYFDLLPVLKLYRRMDSSTR